VLDRLDFPCSVMKGVSINARFRGSLVVIGSIERLDARCAIQQIGSLNPTNNTLSTNRGETRSRSFTSEISTALVHQPPPPALTPPHHHHPPPLSPGCPLCSPANQGERLLPALPCPQVELRARLKVCSGDALLLSRNWRQGSSSLQPVQDHHRR
jgi:hypothetical protein